MWLQRIADILFTHNSKQTHVFHYSRLMVWAVKWPITKSPTNIAVLKTFLFNEKSTISDNEYLNQKAWDISHFFFEYFMMAISPVGASYNPAWFEVWQDSYISKISSNTYMYIKLQYSRYESDCYYIDFVGTNVFFFLIIITKFQESKQFELCGNFLSIPSFFIM